MEDRNRKHGLIGELARRGVYQSLALYVAIAWGTTEILITVGDRFGWPGWIGDAALVLFLTGLPFVVLLSWAFDLSRSGLRRVDPGSLRGWLAMASAATVVIGITATVVTLRQPGKTVGDEAVIAVLPIQDFTAKDGGALLALSFTGELIHRVSAHPDLMALDLRTVTNPVLAGMGLPLAGPGGGSQGVMADYFVQGSLHPARGGTLLRVRMSDASGSVIWEEETVRALGDAVAARVAQAEVAGQIAAAVGRTLTGTDYCEPSGDSEAVALYYQGWQRFSERSGEGVAAAARSLEAAIERDPDYARALADLASVYLRFGFWLAGDPSPYFENRAAFEDFMGGNAARTHELTEQAIARCPGLGLAYFIHETTQPVQLSAVDVRAILDEALRREPDNVTLLNDAHNQVRTYGHTSAALAYAERAYRKDPLNPRSPHLLNGALATLGDFPRAIELEREARDLGYSRRVTDMVLAMLYVATDDEVSLRAHLAESMPDGFTPSPIMPVDPLRILRARRDATVHARVTDEFIAALAELDGTNTERYLRWVKLLDNEALVWRYLEHFANGPRERGDGWIAAHVWDAGWRPRIANDRLMDLMGWREAFGAYWTAFGPPDGCTWLAEQLTCDG